MSQVLNDKLEVQCSELKATVQSITLENTRMQTEYQNNIKVHFKLKFSFTWFIGMEKQLCILNTLRNRSSC